MYREIEKNIETVNNLRRDKYIGEGKLKKYVEQSVQYLLHDICEYVEVELAVWYSGDRTELWSVETDYKVLRSIYCWL